MAGSSTGVPRTADAAAAGDNQHPKLPSDWQRCHAFMSSKGRYCRASKDNLLPPPPNSSHGGTEAIYCGNHVHLYGMGAAADGDKVEGKSKKGKRIPCPIDPSHEVYESRLEKHLKVCPAATRKQNDAALPYYQENANCGGCGYLSSNENDIGGCGGDDKEDSDSRPRKRTRSNDNENEWAKELALRVLDAYETLFISGDETAITDGSSKLGPQRIQHLSALTFDDLIGGIPTEDLSEAEFNAGLQSSVSAQKIRAGGPKHLRQIGSLIGHLRRRQLFPSISEGNDDERSEQIIDTVLEMGAGRGMTGLVAAGVLSASTDELTDGAKLIMVERAGTRGKADTTIRRAIEAKKQRGPSDSNGSEVDSYLDLTRVQMTRIKCDLAHVHLQTALESVNEAQSSQKNIVIVAKHLCGAGTDIALKSLEPISHRVAGCVFATCCHGVCNWTDYVGRDYLRGALANDDGATFGEKEFNLMKRWGAGSAFESESSTGTSAPTDTTTARDVEEEGDNHNTNATEVGPAIDYPQKLSSVVSELGLMCGSKGLGRACQRLIDHGRVEYMKQILYKDGSETSMKHYVDPEVTPQNALLCSVCTN